MSTNTFVTWLLKQADPDKPISAVTKLAYEDNPISDLAHDMKRDSRSHNLGSSYESLRTRMVENMACDEALCALEEAHKKWSNSTQ